MGISRSNTTNAVIFGGIIMCAVCILNYFASRPDSEYYTPVPRATHVDGQQFAGSETCVECHAEIYAAHSNTAHYRSSVITGQYASNEITNADSTGYLLNDQVRYKIVKMDSGLFQEAYQINNGALLSRLKMDITIGSGTKGHTYLNWNRDALHQLQVSYFSRTKSWTNSPGLESIYAPRARMANTSCLECHVTFAKSTSLYGMGNTYDKKRVMFGIDCERCHGPALAHVVAHRAEPKLRIPKNVIIWDTLTRQQKLDACALCHSGIRTPKQPAFAFLTGDTLDNFSTPVKLNGLYDVDVHGNQYGLLAASKCFLKSETMDCNTCHDSHIDQRANIGFYNAKCVACHAKQLKCSVTEPLTGQNASDCITCHMPLRPSKSMVIERPDDGTEVPVTVRSHLITVYIDKLSGS